MNIVLNNCQCTHVFMCLLQKIWAQEGAYLKCSEDTSTGSFPGVPQLKIVGDRATSKSSVVQVLYKVPVPRHQPAAGTGALGWADACSETVLGLLHEMPSFHLKGSFGTICWDFIIKLIPLQQ